MSIYGYIKHNELAHHGIKGQKWGVRRYQTIDGSLTPAGKLRYSSTKYARSVRKDAEKKIEKISSDVISSAKASGSRMYGLKNKLKTESSIRRKIDKKSIEDNILPELAAKDIKDAIRFTTISDDNNFVKNYNSFKDILSKKGYEEVKCKNYFDEYKKGKVKHKAVQSIFMDKGGYQFEIQFQTPASQKAKDKKVPIYEERRQVGINKSRAEELERQMDILAKQVPDPKNIYTIKSH